MYTYFRRQWNLGELATIPYNFPGTSSPPNGHQRACPLTPICHFPLKTNPAIPQQHWFQDQLWGLKGQSSCLSVQASLSPWNVNPVYLHAYSFLSFETSSLCHLLHKRFSDLSPSYKCPSSPKNVMHIASTHRLCGKQSAGNNSMSITTFLKSPTCMIIMLTFQAFILYSSELPEVRDHLSPFKYILLIKLLQFSPLSSPLCPAPPNTPAPPPLVHIHGFVHISSLTSPFSILFLTSPNLVYAYHLCFLFPVPFPHHSSPPPPHWKPSMWSPFLWFCSCSSCLLSFCFHFLRFSCCQLWVCCHFTVHRIEGQIKYFPDKVKLKEFIITKSLLYEMLKELI